jgi:penicillin V acylase-like amidase (Ntn superfamily)
MIKNIVKTKDNYEFTRYTSCYINNTLYYKTYYSNIRFISLNDFDLNDNKLIYINLNNKIDIKKEEKT